MKGVLVVAVNWERRRWVVLVASCLINLCIGSLYAWSVFAGPMAAHFSLVQGTAVSAGSLAIVFTICNACGPVTVIGGGLVNDRIGPRWVVLAGGLLFGGGFLLSGFAQGLPLLIVGFAICSGLGMGLVYGCTINNTIKFFPDKRGLIGGLTTATYGLSSVLVPPLATALIAAHGVLGAFRILGIVFLAVICVGSLFLVQCPPGYAPPGFSAPTAGRSAAVQGVDKDWRQMLRDPVCYLMLAMIACGAFCGLMVISQAASLGQTLVGLSAAGAAAVVSVLALFNATGRVACGFISDKLGRVQTLAIMLVVAMAGLVLLYCSGPERSAFFYTGVIAVGLAFGAFMGVFPGFTADRFGAKHNSVNYGVMFIGFAAAGVTAPLVIARLYAASGSYQGAFLVALAIAAAGLALTFVYRRRA